MLKKIIVVSPHPDDETFGAGGTVLKYKDHGCKAYWLNITDMKEEFGFSGRAIRKRKKEMEKASVRYKFDGFFNLQLMPTGLDTYPNSFIIDKIGEVFEKVRPDTVILPFKGDAHSDHRIVFDCGYACTKIFRFPYVKQVLIMEIISETDFSCFSEGFSPNYFVDISDYIEKKIEIMDIYKNQMSMPPFPRNKENVKALSMIRGTQAGCRYAESFILLKEIR